MFFFLSKLIWFFIQPLGLVLLALLLATAGFLYRSRRLARRLVIALTLAFAAVCLLPVGDLMILPLENRFAKPHELPATVDGVIVLGGAELTVLSGARGEPMLNGNAERLFAGLDLARRFPEAQVVFSGGLGDSWNGVPAQSDIFRDVMRMAGLPEERLVLEGQARNTDENVLLLKQLVQPQAGQHWVLVTSAYHMPRAMGLFAKAGWAVVPWPVDYRGLPPALLPRSELGEQVDVLSTALHEWIGLLAYWATGRIDTLFPGP
ncbi:YdcF family protein [Inquilinus limosus]|uniref:YdcF family protein n=1 Tax=Inquilinus limosus TaxID=171674 RepID=UPI0004030426|nr:YdcF family protein [Inquilinus limosus]